jgi:hypothetical protein
VMCWSLIIELSVAQDPLLLPHPVIHPRVTGPGIHYEGHKLLNDDMDLSGRTCVWKSWQRGSGLHELEENVNT